jgi:hypothetical protein
MKHGEINSGMLRAHLDGEVIVDRASALGEHVGTCADCQAELKLLKGRAAIVHDGLDFLPQAALVDSSAAWVALQKKLDRPVVSRTIEWKSLRTWSLAGAAVVVVAVVLVLTVAPVRAWAENLLAIFRVERFTVLELNPDAMKGNGLQNEALFNQEVGRFLSDKITVTEAPKTPVPVADAAAASRLAGFPVQLIGGETPSVLLFRSGLTAQLTLDRDRLQSILDEAGRNDLQIPQSLDGAIIGMHVPAGITARYGNCGDRDANGHGQNQKQADVPAVRGDATCISLIELRSPTVSAPQQLDPAQIAQIALQFFGMSANDAASFTQTVDWTTTLVLPVTRGMSSYEKVNVGGNEGALLRSLGPQPPGGFDLLWVDNGIVYILTGTGDDTTAVNLASRLE